MPSTRDPMVAQAGRRLLGPVVAVAVVVVVIALLVVINGHPAKHSTTQQVATQQVDARPSIPLLAVPTPSGHGDRKRGSAPRPASSTASPSPSAAGKARAPVVVLNNSRRTGLAHFVGGELRTRGWDVTYVGNLRGRVLAPTAYYAPGQRPAAEHLAHEFPAVARVLPNRELGLHARGVTLVLTESWTG